MSFPPLTYERTAMAWYIMKVKNTPTCTHMNTHAHFMPTQCVAVGFPCSLDPMITGRSTLFSCPSYHAWATHTHYKHPLYSHTHTHFHYAAIHSAAALYTQAPGAPGERKGSANKLSPGPELRFQPSVHRGWEAMGTWSARGPVSIRSSGSTQWGPACRQHCWQIYTQKSLWMGRRLVHTFTRVNTHTHTQDKE